MKSSLTCILCMVCLVLTGQDTYRYYSTNTFNTNQENQYLDLKIKRSQIENDILKLTNADTTGQVNIVTIFHVLLSDPKEVRDQDIKEQIKILNDCFNTNQKLHSKLEKYDRKKKYTPSIARIEFCVSKNSFGINRKQFNTINAPDSTLKNTLRGGISPVQTDKYLNIWITQLDKNHAGYAQWPGGSVTTDGIVINADYFANKKGKSRKYEMGRTLVHLVGSYLGLIELWGKIDGVCDDDYVDDTPIHNGPNYTAVESFHISLCSDQPELDNNYMDNSDDEFGNHFTRGQVIRMRKMLAAGGPRNKLTLQDCKENQLDDEITTSRTLEEKARIIPNPNTGIFSVTSDRSNFIKTLSIYNLDGRVVYQNQFNGGMPEIKIDLSSLANGVYIIHLTRESNDRETYKVVIFK